MGLANRLALKCISVNHQLVGLRQIPYFAVYNALPWTICTHVFGPNFQEKKSFFFYFLIQLFIYVYLETKPMIIFQGIILHMDIITAF